MGLTRYDDHETICPAMVGVPRTWRLIKRFLQQYHQSVIDNARKAESEQPGRPLAIALDTVSSMLLPSLLSLPVALTANLYVTY